MDARTIDKASRRAFPLTGFQQFLLDRACSPSTIGSYLAYVRRALRAAKPGSLPDQATVGIVLLSLPIPRRAGFQTAWKRYVEYAHGQGTELPLIHYATTGLDDLRVVRENLPKFVAMTGFKPRELYDLKMRMVQPTSIGIQFNPSTVRAPVRLLQANPPTNTNLDPFYAIMEWAYPKHEYDGDAPFLPDGPEGDVPIPLRTIRSIIVSGRRTMTKEVPLRVVRVDPVQVAVDEVHERQEHEARATAPLFDVEKPPTADEEAELEAELQQEEIAKRGRLPSTYMEQPQFAGQDSPDSSSEGDNNTNDG